DAEAMPQRFEVAHLSGAGPPQATDTPPLGAASGASVGVVSSEAEIRFERALQKRHLEPHFKHEEEEHRRTGGNGDACQPAEPALDAHDGGEVERARDVETEREL